MMFEAGSRLSDGCVQHAATGASHPGEGLNGLTDFEKLWASQMTGSMLARCRWLQWARDWEDIRVGAR